jgi:hypothetical protein
MLIAETKIPARIGTVAGAIVLRKLEKGGGSYEYVTHFRRDDDGSFNQGSYFTVWNDYGPLRAAAIFAEAAKDYAERVAKCL